MTSKKKKVRKTPAKKRALPPRFELVGGVVSGRVVAMTRGKSPRTGDRISAGVMAEFELVECTGIGEDDAKSWIAEIKEVRRWSS